MPLYDACVSWANQLSAFIGCTSTHSVRYVGGGKCIQDVYYTVVLFQQDTGKDGQTLFFAGWCGSLALVNNSPALLSNLSHCETRLRVEWQGRSLIFFLPQSLSCSLAISSFRAAWKTKQQSPLFSIKATAFTHKDLKIQCVVFGY